MKITQELSLENFDAWGGGLDTLRRVIEEGKAGKLEAILEEEYPDGIDADSLNDLLAYETKQVYDWCGITPEPNISTFDTTITTDPDDYDDGEMPDEIEGIFEMDDEFGGKHDVEFSWHREENFITLYGSSTSEESFFEDCFSDEELIERLKPEFEREFGKAPNKGEHSI